MATLEQAEQALKMGRYGDAYESYSSLLATDEPKAPAYSGMATCLYLLQSYEQAAEMARAALDLREDLAQPHLILAYILDRGGDSAQALAHAKRALELSPDMPEALEYAGAILIVDGDLTNGIPLVERSIQLEPNMWSAHAMLGYAHNVKGETREARREFWIAFRLQPSAVTLNALVRTYLTSYRLWIVSILLLAFLAGFWLKMYWLPATVAVLEMLAGVLQVWAGEGKRGWVLVLTSAVLLAITIFFARR